MEKPVCDPAEQEQEPSSPLPILQYTHHHLNSSQMGLRLKHKTIRADSTAFVMSLIRCKSILYNNYEALGLANVSDVIHRSQSCPFYSPVNFMPVLYEPSKDSPPG